MRKFLADTFALVAFSTLAGMFRELLLAGMTLAQSVQARATAVPVMLVTARPYGLFRDWAFRVSKSAEAATSDELSPVSPRSLRFKFRSTRRRSTIR